MFHYKIYIYPGRLFLENYNTGLFLCYSKDIIRTTYLY